MRLLIASLLLLASMQASAMYEIINLSDLYMSGSSQEITSGPYAGLTTYRSGYARDINESGIIVGEWYLGAQMYIDPLLGSRYVGLGAGINITGINNNNDIVAFSSFGTIIDDTTYRWIVRDGTDGTLTGVSTSNFSPYGGRPDIDDDENLFRGLYTGPTDLFSLLPENPGWDRLIASSMNSRGQIVGWGTPTESAGIPYGAGAGYDTPFLMNPIGVPEPTTLTLMGLGLAGIGFARKRRRFS